MFKLATGLSVLLLLVAVLFSSPQVSAASTTNFRINGIYLKDKTLSKFDIVVNYTKDTRLTLYVNDKKATAAAVNNDGWATFRRVKLTGSGKLSFTKEVIKNGKKAQQPINYSKKFEVQATKITLSDFPKPAAKTSTPTVTQPKTTAPAPQPVATPAPQPAATPDVYYANCTAARAAGAAPIYRGEAGYRSALDRDNDGIACE